MTPRSFPTDSEGVPPLPATAWPSCDLERVPACPVCRSTRRQTLLENVIDNVFFVAPGRWHLSRCMQCGSAYLDPRPDAASIGRAYGHYYTHTPAAPRTDVAALSGFRKLRRMLANGYVNHRYGCAYLPESSLGQVVARWLPRMRAPLDIKFRYLPRPIPGQRLLDIGCGNGDFLCSARDAGWEVVGLEPDPAAADVAMSLGLDVRLGSLDALAGSSDCFDAVTMSHVIEHMHAPTEAVAHAHRLLRPGGVLFLETPNIASHGASEFGRNWRGLECPRHLVLFTPTSLAGLLADAGFVDVETHRRPSVASETYTSSHKMSQGLSPYSPVNTDLSWRLRCRLALGWTRTARLEFITVTARKSGARV